MDITTKMYIKSTASNVYEAFVQPEMMKQFWFDVSEYFEEGKTIHLGYSEYHAELTIEIVTLIENELIVFYWPSDVKDRTKVSISIETVEDGVIVTATEHDLPNDMQRLLGQKEGFVYMLSCLKAYIEDGKSDLRAALRW